MPFSFRITKSLMTENTLLAHDHSELDDALAGLLSALSDGDAARSLEGLDCFWARLAVHIRAENFHLFPALLCAIERRDESTSPAGEPKTDEVQTLIARLRENHDFFMTELAAAVKQLRGLCKCAQPGGIGEVREKIEAVSRRLEVHNALEGSQAYGWASVLLDPREQVASHGKIRWELKNLPARFRKSDADV